MFLVIGYVCCGHLDMPAIPLFLRVHLARAGLMTRTLSGSHAGESQPILLINLDPAQISSLAGPQSYYIHSTMIGASCSLAEGSRVLVR